MEEAILRVHVALRHEQIGRRVGVDVGDAEAIAHDFDRALQAGQLRFAAGLRKRRAREKDHAAAERGGQDDDEGEQADQETLQDAHGADYAFQIADCTFHIAHFTFHIAHGDLG